MRLRTFESYWLLRNGIIHSYPMLQENVRTSLVVVGGGITGALISDALMERGYEVLLIDRRDIGLGSTAATTSLLQYEIDVPLYKLAKLIGREEAAMCYQAGIKAIDTIGELITEKRIDCGFSRKESLYVAHNKKSVQGQREEYRIRKEFGLGVEWLEREDIRKDYGMECFGGILSSTAASVDAYKLAHELIHLNTRRGMRVSDQTTVANFDFNKNGARLTTSEGFTIDCEKIIFCTGFESTEMISEKIADLFYTYASISEENTSLPEKLNDTIVWNTDDPYFYMRTTEGGRILIGGEDTSRNISLFQQKRKEKKADKLMKKLSKIAPSIKFIEDFSWGGTFGATKDGLPYVGASPEFENALFVLGFGGNGITFSIQARDIICDLLEGKKNDLARCYRFGR